MITAWSTPKGLQVKVMRSIVVYNMVGNFGEGFIFTFWLSECLELSTEIDDDLSSLLFVPVQ